MLKHSDLLKKGDLVLIKHYKFDIVVSENKTRRDSYLEFRWTGATRRSIHHSKISTFYLTFTKTTYSKFYFGFSQNIILFK